MICFSIRNQYNKRTLRGFRMALGLLFSLDASSVTSRLVFRSNIRKKLLYEPVIMTLMTKQKRAKVTGMIQQMQRGRFKQKKNSLTCLIRSRHTQTCQKCSHSHTENKVCPVNSRGPGQQEGSSACAFITWSCKPKPCCRMLYFQ